MLLVFVYLLVVLEKDGMAKNVFVLMGTLDMETAGNVHKEHSLTPSKIDVFVLTLIKYLLHQVLFAFLAQPTQSLQLIFQNVFACLVMLNQEILAF